MEMISLILRVSMLEQMRRRRSILPAAFLYVHFMKMRFKIKCRVQMNAEVFITCSGVMGESLPDSLT